MKKLEVLAVLQQVAVAKGQWYEAHKEFNAAVDRVLLRLIHEAVRNFMSAEEFARASGLTVKRVRVLMRSAGLDPKQGKRLLSKKAAEALAENAALLGIEPHEMDLTSPLAYLPMGKQMKQALIDKTTEGVTEVPMENDEVVTGYTSLTEAVHDLHLRGGRLRYVCPACGLTGDEVSGNQP